MAAIWRQMCVI